MITCRCGKRKLLGGGWVQEGSTWYCPACWAEEQEKRRKREEWEREAAAKNLAAYAAFKEGLEATRRELLVFAEKEAGLPSRVAGPASAAAWYALKLLADILKSVDQIGKKPPLRLVTEINDLLYGWSGEKIKTKIPGTLALLQSLAGMDERQALLVLAEWCLQWDIGIGYRENVGDEDLVKILLKLVEADLEAVFDLLLRAVCDPQAKPPRRDLAIAALGELGDPKAIDPLLALLAQAKPAPFDDEYSVPSLCCTLAVLGDERVVLPVLTAARRHFCSGAYGHWKPREFIVPHLKRLAPPGSPTHRQVQEMRKEVAYSSEFWDSRWREMIDELLNN